MIKLKASKETPLKGCNCGSKLNHWKKFTGMQVRMCFVPGCRNPEIDGGYVTKSKTDAITNEQIDKANLKETCNRNDANHNLFTIRESLPIIILLSPP